ncbi:hypothetical protein DER44DRAFT_891970 [Fusarium oxysporum]|nr:hypothetical protein DER44DRAFT_891970 [Fusarium oxysporum]
MNSTSLCDGLPYLSISESKPYQRKTRLEEIVDASFHYRIKCHDILIDATIAFGDIIDEQGEGSSPYDMNRTAPESVQTGATDASTYWNSTAAPVGDSFGSSNFPEVYTDWNFPLDLDYLG